MPENELDRARRLLQSPNLSPEDRNAIMESFPELSSPSPTPAPTAAPVPTPEPSAMVPPNAMPTQAPTAAAPQPQTMGISAQDIPALGTAASAPLDLTYSGIADGIEADKDIKKDLSNASKRLSLYNEPKINAENFGNTFIHIEPSVDEVKRWAARNGNKNALSKLDSEGEESSVYKEYADMQWRKVYEAFSKTKEGAIRISYLDPDTTLDWLHKATGYMGGKGASFLGGFDDAVSFGVGKQVLSGLRNKFVAEQALEQAGVLEPFAKRLETMQGSNPLTSLAGTVAGFALPLGAGGALGRAGSSIVKKSGSKVAKILDPFAEAAISGGALGAVREGGEALRGEDTIDWSTAGDVGIEALLSGLIGGSLGNAARKLGSFFKERSKAVHSSPKIKEDLARIGMGRPEVKGGTSMKPLSGGVRPNKIYAKKVDEIAEERYQARAEGLSAPAPRSATRELADKVQKDMRDELHKFVNDTKSAVRAIEEPYFRSTDNIEDRFKADMAPIGRRIQEMIAERSNSVGDKRWDLPFNEEINKSLSKTLNSMGSLITDQTGESQWVWRKLTPRELQKSIGALDEMLDVETNKTKSGGGPAWAKELQRLLREARDKFPANEYAPETMVEHIKVGNDTITVKGGLSAITARSKRMFNDMRNAQYAVGIEDVKPEDVLAQIEAVTNRALGFGLEKNKASDDVLRSLFKGRTDIMDLLEAVGSGEGFESFRKGTGEIGVTGRSSSVTPGIWASLGLTSMFGPYADPAYMALSKLKGKGGEVASATGMRRKELEAIPGSELAMQTLTYIPDKVIPGLPLLYKLYKDAKERGIIDELRKAEDKSKTSKDKAQKDYEKFLNSSLGSGSDDPLMKQWYEQYSK